MTVDPTTVSKNQALFPQTTVTASSSTATTTAPATTLSPAKNSDLLVLPSNSSEICNNNNTSMMLSYARTLPQPISPPLLSREYHHITSMPEDSNNSSASSTTSASGPPTPGDSNSTTAPSPTSAKPTLPKPPTGRLPVRLGLSDPRIHNYLPPARFAALPSQLSHGSSTQQVAASTASTSAPTASTTSITPTPSTSYQDQTHTRSDQSKPSHAAVPRTKFETSRTHSHPYRTQATSHSFSSHASEDAGLRGLSKYRHAYQSGIDRQQSTHTTESHSTTARANSTSPDPFPSPPESMLASPDLYWGGPGKGRWNFDPNNQHEEQQEKMRQKGRSE
ncbi:hypothetical protein BGZ65_005724, partial [Modicella reniformis]